MYFKSNSYTVKQGDEQQGQTFDSLNHYSSDLVETILVLLRKSEAEQALSQLEKGEVILVDRSHLERYRQHLTAYQKNEQELRKLVEEIKSERDILLGSVNHLYQTFSFVFQAIEEAKQQEKPKLSGMAKGIKLVCRTAGFGKIDDPIIYLLERIFVSARANLDPITQNFQEAGSKLGPSLEILIKHQIVDQKAINLSTDE